MSLSQSRFQFPVCTSSTLKVIGEIQVTLTKDRQVFHFEGSVVKDLDYKVIARTPCSMTSRTVWPPKRKVLLGDGSSYTYSSPPTKATTLLLDMHSYWEPHYLHRPFGEGNFWKWHYELVLHPMVSMHLSPVLTPQFSPSHLWPQACITSTIARRIRIPNLSS